MAKTTESGCPIVPSPLSPSFLVTLAQVRSWLHYGPFGTSGVVELKHCAPNGAFSAFGKCVAKSHGMFNTSEEVSLTLGKSTISFNRQDYTGEWKLDETPIATTTISFVRKVFHKGDSATLMRDGTLVRVRPPFVLDTQPKFKDCICRAHVGDGTEIQMFLQRKGNQAQLIFDRSELGLLEQLSDEIRAVLLGEWLRVKCSSG